jgi:hypothetical protein
MASITILGSRSVRRRCPRTGITTELTAEGLYVRERGRRLAYGPIPYSKLLLIGAQQYVAEQKREKERLRREKCAARRR